MSKKVLLGSILSIFIGAILFRLVFLGNKDPSAWLLFGTKYLIVIGVFCILVGLSLKRILGVQRTNKLLLNLSTLIASTVIVLVITEYALRFVYRDVTTTADNQSYFATQWLKTVHLNKRGFREREFELNKPKGVYRIAVIGDSFTYGQGIAENDRFTNLLERQLNGQAEDRRFEVLNFGRPGAETIDHLAFLHDVVLDTAPDFVLLQWYVNDVQLHEVSNQTQPFALIPPQLRENSALFYLVHQQVAKILGSGTTGDDDFLARFGPADSTDSRTAKENLHAFIDSCKEHQVPVGIVVFSDSYFRESPLDFLADRVLQICEEQAIPCVDVRYDFAPYKGDHKLWANRLDPHPSVFANKLVSDHLLTSRIFHP